MGGAVSTTCCQSVMLLSSKDVEGQGKGREGYVEGSGRTIVMEMPRRCVRAEQRSNKSVNECTHNSSPECHVLC